MAYTKDPYADVDFDEVTEATGLAIDEIKCLKVKTIHISANAFFYIYAIVLVHPKSGSETQAHFFFYIKFFDFLLDSLKKSSSSIEV